MRWRGTQWAHTWKDDELGVFFGPGLEVIVIDDADEPRPSFLGTEFISFRAGTHSMHVPRTHLELVPDQELKI